MKAENLPSLEGAEHIMVRWMCIVSLKDRKQSEDWYRLLGDHLESGGGRGEMCR